jgi:hypothetical protein
MALSNNCNLEPVIPTEYLKIFLAEIPSFEVLTNNNSASFGEYRTSKSLKPTGF